MSPSGMARWARALAVALSLAAMSTACGPSSKEIEIKIARSRFEPAHLTVKRGQTVRFVIANADPIAHEIVIAPHAEQLLHEKGAQKSHDGLPGQASLDIGETQTISYTFTRAGPVEFACHRPGHYAYGMRGVIEVA